MNNILFMKMFDSFQNLREVWEVLFSIDWFLLKNSIFKKLLKRVAWAKFHLNHYLNCEEIFTILYDISNCVMSKSNTLTWWWSFTINFFIFRRIKFSNLNRRFLNITFIIGVPLIFINSVLSFLNLFIFCFQIVSL